MAQNEPQRKETPPGPSPNSPSLLFEYQCRSGKFITLANRIESKLFCPNWNALPPSHARSLLTRTGNFVNVEFAVFEICERARRATYRQTWI